MDSSESPVQLPEQQPSESQPDRQPPPEAQVSGPSETPSTGPNEAEKAKSADVSATGNDRSAASRIQERRAKFERVGEDSVQHDISHKKYGTVEEERAALVFRHDKRQGREIWQRVMIVSAIVAAVVGLVALL